jgi:hypothetical protein
MGQGSLMTQLNHWPFGFRIRERDTQFDDVDAGIDHGMHRLNRPIWTGITRNNISNKLASTLRQSLPCTAL